MTLGLVVACVAIWVAELVVPGLIDLLALSPDRALAEPWRWITSAFSHSLSPAHIGFNMLALWMVGQGMEHFLGRVRFLMLYLLSALGGAVAFVVLATPPSAAQPLGVGWYTGLVGASGAVFGLFGALVIVQRRLGQDTRGLWAVLAINAVLSFVIPDVAWQAHVGGFVVGAATMALLMVRPRSDPRGVRPAWQVFLPVAIVLVAVVATKYLVVTG